MQAIDASRCSNPLSQMSDASHCHKLLLQAIVTSHLHKPWSPASDAGYCRKPAVTSCHCKPLSQAIFATHCCNSLLQASDASWYVLLQGADNFAREFKQLRRSFRFNEYKSISDVNPPRNFLERVSPGLVQADHLSYSTAWQQKMGNRAVGGRLSCKCMSYCTAQPVAAYKPRHSRFCSGTCRYNPCRQFIMHFERYTYLQFTVVCMWQSNGPSLTDFIMVIIMKRLPVRTRA